MLARAKPMLNSQKVTCRISHTTFDNFYKPKIRVKRTFSDELEKFNFFTRFLHAFLFLSLVHHEKFKHDDVQNCVNSPHHSQTHTRKEYSHWAAAAAKKKVLLTHKILIDWNWNSCPLGGIKKPISIWKFIFHLNFPLIKYEFLAIFFHFRNYYYNLRLLAYTFNILLEWEIAMRLFRLFYD